MLTCSRNAELKQSKQTTKQLTEVHAKLLMLRRQIWTGLDGTENQPLSWGFSSFVSENAKKGTDAHKKKTKPPSEQGKAEKKTKKKGKSKLLQEEDQKPQAKKKTNGYNVVDLQFTPHTIHLWHWRYGHFHKHQLRFAVHTHTQSAANQWRQ